LFPFLWVNFYTLEIHYRKLKFIMSAIFECVYKSLKIVLFIRTIHLFQKLSYSDFSGYHILNSLSIWQPSQTIKLWQLFQFEWDLWESYLKGNWENVIYNLLTMWLLIFTANQAYKIKRMSKAFSIINIFFPAGARFLTSSYLLESSVWL